MVDPAGIQVYISEKSSRLWILYGSRRQQAHLYRSKCIKRIRHSAYIGSWELPIQ